MIKLFWKTYQVTLTRTDQKQFTVLFLRGFVWQVVTIALKEAKEKTEKEDGKWAVSEIKRI